MALILLLETATPVCSVALSRDGQVISSREVNEANVHASKLTLFIEAVMKEARVKYRDLNAVAVSRGPGSYTGLRIGVSTAKGLCFALGIPLIAVDTLEAMATGYLQSAGEEKEGLRLCPMIDARRMEVYLAVFSADLDIVEPVQARILDEGTFAEYPRIVLFGDGAAKCRALYADHPNIRIEQFPNSARYLNTPAFRKFEEQEFEDVAYFEPFYLKDFVAGKPRGQS
ncbi:MAG TPA: tRNA (adenosine(37)-N6)-threonylcarbamoyltransferase complex dimerization subunit type 1 TsaB [Sphingobacteriaceae bacterium]